MSGDPVSPRTRSAVRVCHVAALLLVGISLGCTLRNLLPQAIVALGLATIAQIFASDVMRVIILLLRDHRR
jgi:hypothetical protein